jgi:hypothetical protein
MHPDSCQYPLIKYFKDFVDHAFNTHPKSIDPLQNEITDGSLNDIQLPGVSEIDNENIKTEEADSVPGKLIINQR